MSFIDFLLAWMLKHERPDLGQGMSFIY